MAAPIMAVALINRLLPAEMLERVFHLLPPRDLKAVVLVCRWWREVGEAPALWAWVRLVVENQSLAVMPEALDARRLGLLRRVEVRAVSADLLEAVVRHPGLVEVEMKHCSLEGMEPELVAMAMAGMEVVGLARRSITSRTSLSHSQLTSLCQALCLPCRVVTLVLDHNDLESVEPELLSRAVRGVQVVGLAGTALTPHQVHHRHIFFRH